MRPRARCGVLCDFIVVSRLKRLAGTFPANLSAPPCLRASRPQQASGKRGKGVGFNVPPQFAACIGALVVSILSQKIGYGDVSFAPGHGGEHRQHVSFGFDIVCVRSASASSADDQTMSDDQIQYVDPVCFRYQDASQQALGQVIPYGSHVVALVAEQLAGPMGPVLKAFNLVSVASFALVLALLLLPLVARLVLCSRVFERPAPAAFLARVSVMALLLGLLSSAGLSAGISSQRESQRPPGPPTRSTSAASRRRPCSHGDWFTATLQPATAVPRRC